MFQDFLCDRVDIYKMQRNTSNRTCKDQMANSDVPILMNIPCRIHEDKAIFLPEVALSVGDVLEDKTAGEQYEIIEKHKARGICVTHHRTYTIKRRSLPSERAEDRN